MKKNIEITGLPGAGKSTLVNKIIKNNPDIFYDRFDLAIKPYKKISNKRKLLNVASRLINLNTKGFWYNQDIANEQDQFSKNYPEFYVKALDNLEIIIQSGFVPSSFWLRWYFNAWLLIALTSKRDNIFLHDEGIGQRLIQYLSVHNVSEDFINQYFFYVDIVVIYDQSFEEALRRACVRDKNKTYGELKGWLEQHSLGIQKLKKFAMTNKKIKIVPPSEFPIFLESACTSDMVN